jgi:hypothetical protein
MRCYFWIIFFAVAVFSIWAFPVDENVDEESLVVIGNENEDVAIESRVLIGEDEEEDDDDDDEEGLIEDGTLDITDRHFGQKPQKKPKNDKKDVKKFKKPKYICFGKKPPFKKPSQSPKPPGNDRIKPCSHNKFMICYRKTKSTIGINTRW